MNILFLDIDGVLNYNQYYIRGRRPEGYPVSELCPVAIDRLNRIVTGTGCKVVISSTWRHSGIDYCRNVLREAGYIVSVYVITPDIHSD